MKGHTVQLRKTVLTAAPHGLFATASEAGLVRHDTTELDLSFNYIPEVHIPQGLWALKILNLGGNRLTEVPSGICHLRHLVELYLNNNSIEELRFNQEEEEGERGTSPLHLSNLRVFDVRQNACGGLLRLPPGCGASLERLTISSNHFDGVDWKTEGAFPKVKDGFPRLKLLSLHGNSKLACGDCLRILFMCRNRCGTSSLSVLFATGSALCSGLGRPGARLCRGNLWDKGGTMRCLARLYVVFKKDAQHEHDPLPKLRWINGNCILREDWARAAHLAEASYGAAAAAAAEAGGGGGGEGGRETTVHSNSGTSTVQGPPKKRRKL